MRIDDYGVVCPKYPKEVSVNLNELAKSVSAREGGKQELNIAQIKEVIKCISIELFKDPDMFHLLYKNGKKWVRGYKEKIKPRVRKSK
jgi:hypothetical protein